MKIGNFDLNKDGVYIIAELSANHNGSLKTALDTIKEAKEIGANAIKLPPSIIKSGFLLFNVIVVLNVFSAGAVVLCVHWYFKLLAFTALVPAFVTVTVVLCDFL